MHGWVGEPQSEDSGMTYGSTRTRTNVSNVLVIGCGAAGLRAAVAAHEAGSEAVVIGTRPRKDAHTVLAAGGINAALGTRDPEDSWQEHFADTLKEGYNLPDPRVVEIMAKEAPRAVYELAEWGAPFAKTPSGELDQRYFGAHKYRRTCYAGDYTGRAMLFALVDKAESLGIPVHEGQYVSKLLAHDGRCFGAYAFDVQSGERYMERYDPERMELSTRDRIALANYTEIAEGRGSEHGGVYLDISHRPKKYILEKLPRMYRQFLEASMIDISKSPMEVAPTAHYTMGGIVVEPETHATGVEGLYAAGETTSGLHGANRLGGNSLSETVVFGRRAREGAAEFSRNADVQLRDRAAIREAAEEVTSFIKEGEEFARPLQRALRDTMQETCGVVRSEEKLTEGLKRLAEIRDASNNVDVRPTSEGFNDLAYALNLRGSLVVAEATILGAIERRETRGAHNRSDYPELDPDLKVNFVVQKRDDGLAVAEEPVHTVPEYLEEWAKSDEEYGVVGRLVE